MGERRTPQSAYREAAPPPQWSWVAREAEHAFNHLLVTRALPARKHVLDLKAFFRRHRLVTVEVTCRDGTRVRGRVQTPGLDFVSLSSPLRQHVLPYATILHARAAFPGSPLPHVNGAAYDARRRRELVQRFGAVVSRHWSLLSRFFDVPLSLYLSRRRGWPVRVEWEPEGTDRPGVRRAVGRLEDCSPAALRIRSAVPVPRGSTLCIPLARLVRLDVISWPEYLLGALGAGRTAG